MAEEPVKPKGRSRKPQPATLSMFEWALILEHEREAERVGVRRKSARQQGEDTENRIPPSPCMRSFCVSAQPECKSYGLLLAG